MNKPTTDWMQTFTGKAFYPLEPEFSTIDIVDIAHALSLQCRFGGHCKSFYSVAEHCVLISHAVPQEYALWGLLHDATEAYLVDLPRPIKKSMPDYVKAEKNLMTYICRHFKLSEEEPKEVKDADKRIIYNERKLLGKSDIEWSNIGEPLPNVEVIGLMPELAEYNFMCRFDDLNTGKS